MTEISKDEVHLFYEEFLQALKAGDVAPREQIYADDHLLVRPNGDILNKKHVLTDVRSVAIRDGVEIKSNARQVAVLSKENGRTTISHFRSTNVADPR